MPMTRQTSTDKSSITQRDWLQDKRNLIDLFWGPIKGILTDVK